MSNFKSVDEANASFEHLKRLYESAKEALTNAEKTNNNLKSENAILVAKLEHCGQSNDKIKQIMQNALTKYNLNVQGYIKDIDELRELLKQSKQ